ncbi:MAG TPA: glycosyltransferase family 2 protein, partial [Oscillatoriaceae cyanobacterium]
MKLSIVTTLYRSSPYVREFYRRAGATADRLGFDWEMILVNDGSPDDAADIALALHAEDRRVVFVDLSRNFGHHKALMSGIAHATGEWIFLIDSDLEEAPELLEQFSSLARAQQADVVFGVQAHRKGGWFERVSGEAYYRLINALCEYPIPRNLITARLMSRRYVDALLQYREREFFLAGLWVLAGFKQVPLMVEKLSSSETTYTLRRKLVIVVDAITSFSSKPLVGIFYLGLVISLLAALAAAGLIVRVLFFGALLQGWASLIVSIWLLGGLTIFCLGVIGIYLAKVFTESKQRPYAIVRALHRHSGELSAVVPTRG